MQIYAEDVFLSSFSMEKNRLQKAVSLYLSGVFFYCILNLSKFPRPIIPLLDLQGKNNKAKYANYEIGKHYPVLQNYFSTSSGNMSRRLEQTEGAEEKNLIYITAGTVVCFSAGMIYNIIGYALSEVPLPLVTNLVLPAVYILAALRQAKRLPANEEIMGRTGGKYCFSLTAKEINLCRLILEDKSAATISRILYINESGVRGSRSRIRKKMKPDKKTNLKARLLMPAGEEKQIRHNSFQEQNGGG